MERLLSLLVAFGYLAVGFWVEGPAALGFLVFLILPLALIWFGDDLGAYVGPSFRPSPRRITSRSPGSLVRILGWVLLLFPAVFGFLLPI